MYGQPPLPAEPLQLKGVDLKALLSSAIDTLKLVLGKIAYQIYLVMNSSGVPHEEFLLYYDLDSRPGELESTRHIIENWDCQRLLNFFLNISGNVKEQRKVKRTTIMDNSSFNSNSMDILDYSKEKEGLVMEILTQANLGDRRLRSIFHDLKYYRNAWAHQKEVSLDELNRLVETILLLLKIMHFPTQTDEYKIFHNSRILLMKEILNRSQFIY